MAVTAKTLDRIRKLIQLTASPNENEARTAAFQACKLIREHKVGLTGEVVYKTRTVEPPGYAENRAPVKPPQTVWPDVAHIRRSKVHGHCADCRLPYHQGGRIVWTRNGYVHLRCWRQVDT